jgi:hypothetical protein
VTLRVEVELKETSQKIVYDDALNTYTKGDLYCVYRSGGTVVKFPLANVWRISEGYRAS